MGPVSVWKINSKALLQADSSRGYRECSLAIFEEAILVAEIAMVAKLLWWLILLLPILYNLSPTEILIP